MALNSYHYYLENVRSLARSIIIKHQASVEGINRLIQRAGLDVGDDPRTWKYYLNLSGQYHQTDQLMLIQSVDERRQISFDYETLKDHPNTLTSYRSKTRLYHDLVERYPHQELLIHGILFPVPMDQLIQAPDRTILYHNAALVESNETQLMDELQRMIYQFQTRWDNAGYYVTDDLYGVAQLGILYYNLIPFILNIRLKYCKTRHAHSFHILEYLKSHGRLNQYAEHMTKTQMLFLYRNILYIQKNIGKQEIFDWLIDELMTKRGLGLAEYDIMHNVKDLKQYLDRTPHHRQHHDHLRVRTDLVRKPLNTHLRSYRNHVHTYGDLLIKQRGIASGNTRVEDRILVEEYRKMQNAKRGVLKTKVLETADTQDGEKGPINRHEVFLNHWGYWASTGVLDYNIQVIHPAHNYVFELTPLNAFILYLYAYNQSIRNTLTQLPSLIGTMVRKRGRIPKETFKTFINEYRVHEDTLREINEHYLEDAPIKNGIEFDRQINWIVKRYDQERLIYGRKANKEVRAFVQACVDYQYEIVPIHLNDTQTPIVFEQWLQSWDLDAMTLSAHGWGQFAQALQNAMKGILETNREAVDTRQLRRVMMQLLNQLSSYTTHFLKEDQGVSSLMWDWPAIRFSEPRIQFLTPSGEYFYRPQILSDIEWDIYQHLNLKFEPGTTYPMFNRLRLTGHELISTPILQSKVALPRSVSLTGSHKQMHAITQVGFGAQFKELDHG